ncbi:MAG: BrxA/BrxB family bacilliredoxin [Bacteroidota bacterium]
MFNINQRQPIYDQEAVQPMRDELIYVGFVEMLTPQSVEEILSQRNDETVFVMINSVCGCAAGSARPGVTLALQHNLVPDKLVTVFAGQDRDAVDHLRQKFLSNFPPSSPSFALFKNGEVLFMMPRHHIEGRSPEEIAEDLKIVFEKFCSKQGPSIPKEKYDELIHAKMCGSKIPMNKN